MSECQEDEVRYLSRRLNFVKYRERDLYKKDKDEDIKRKVRVEEEERASQGRDKNEKEKKTRIINIPYSDA